MRRKSTQRGKWLLLSLAVGPVGWSAESRAVDVDIWNVGSGNWATAGNWSTDKVPGAGDFVFVGAGNTATFNTTYNYTGANVTLGSLFVDMSNTAATASLVMAAGTLLTAFESVGNADAGTFNQSGGLAAVTGLGGSLYIGNLSNSTGTYILSGTGIVSPTNEYLGYSGNGLVSQSGGTNSPEFIDAGFNANSEGIYTLFDGTCSASRENIGYSGLGTVDQLGGENSVGDLDIGVQSTSPNLYILINGALSTSNGETVGDQGVGRITQSGGTNTASTTNLGSIGGSSGTYNLSGGSYTSSYEFIGVGGLGLFNQSGGSNVASTELDIGSQSTATNTYVLSNGSVQSPDEIVGDGGVGIFNQSGGTNSVTNTLCLGNTSSGTGTFNLTGGGLTDSVEEVGNAGLGVFNQSGGLNHPNTLSVGVTGQGTFYLSASGTVTAGIVYVGQSGPGIFNQSGGQISEGTLSIGNSANGTFIHSAGTNSPEDLTIGNGAGAMGAYILSGSGSLSAPNEFVGDVGVGIVDQSGGANSITPSGGGVLSIGVNAGSTGTYTLSSGSVSTEYEQVGEAGAGTMNQSGGSNTISAEIAIGVGAESTGTYILSGTGILNCQGANEIISQIGDGTLTQNGGVNDIIAGNLFIGISSTGSYTMTRGQLYVQNSLSVGGSTFASGGPGTLIVGALADAVVGNTLQVWTHGQVQINGQMAIGQLSIATGGVVNVNSSLLINYGSLAISSPEGLIQQFIRGGEIVSAITVDNPSFGIAYADGSDPGLNDPNLESSQVVIEPDLVGDTDLNGTVNIHDLQASLSNFNSPGFWDQGNFNGHANVDISDLTALLTNFNNATALNYSELSGIENLVGEFGDVAVPNANGTGFTLVAVPEPAAAMLAALGTALLIRRLRHR
jgi:hypothetical protein